MSQNSKNINGRKSDTSADKEFSIVDLFYKYLPYWPIFTVLLIVFLIGAFLTLRYVPAEYEVTSSVLVKDQKKGVDDSNLMDQLDLFGSKKLVENEIEVIHSNVVLKQVVRNLSLYAPIREEGRVHSVSAYVNSPVKIQVLVPDSLRPVKKVFFKYDSLKRSVKVGAKEYPLNAWVKDSLGTLRFIKNNHYQPELETPKPLYFSLISVKKVSLELAKDLKIAQATKLSSVLNLSIRDEIPVEGEDILNEVMAVYDSASVYDKNSLASNTLKFINQRLGLVTLELDSVERGIQLFKTREGIIDLSAQGQLYLDNVGANDAKQSEINVQLAALNEVQNYITSNQAGSKSMVPSAMVNDNPVLGELLTKLYEAELKYETLKKTTAENNPMLIAVQSEISRIRPNLLENVINQKANLEAAKRNLQGTSSDYAKVLTKLPKKEKGLIEISRQQVIMNNIYSFLLQKREETSLSFYSAVADSRIIDTAESTIKPVSPKPVVVFGAAIILSILAGTVVIALKEISTRRILFRTDIEKYTDVPIVGEILYNENGGDDIVVKEGERTYISEQFRSLRTSLAYLGINSRKKRILVTSSITQEGKSFVTANLGISLALTNKKVVLIELDLRKPRLSKAFGLEKGIGISNYLIGSKDADEIIKNTGVHENLFIISSGAIPPNPSELILNGMLEQLLQYLDSIFDYIIIDTAPAVPVTDAYILSPFCDATLYVVRHDITPKEYIKQLDDNIKIRTLKNLALVFNGVKKRGMTANTYGYGYGSNEHSYQEYFDKTEVSSSKKKSFFSSK